MYFIACFLDFFGLYELVGASWRSFIWRWRFVVNCWEKVELYCFSGSSNVNDVCSCIGCFMDIVVF